mgnify:CR=1 FL=1
MSKMILVYSTSWLGEVQRYWFREEGLGNGKPVMSFMGVRVAIHSMVEL